MSRFNEGIIFTNEKCVGCNTCIATCPVLGANVAIEHNGVQKVMVSKKCIHCGNCVKTCTHGAREFRDDLDKMLQDLDAGESISILVDPAFYVDYADDAEKILGYLKSIGIKEIYDVGFGADLSIWAHARYIKQETAEKGNCSAFITNSCAAVINDLENSNPDLLKLVIPVHSPLLCTAIYVKKYLHDNSKLAYISPCIAREDEVGAVTTRHNVTYNVTFAKLVKYVGDRSALKKTAKSSLKSIGLGNMISYLSGFRDALAMCFPEDALLLYYSGLTKNVIKTLRESGEHTMQHPLAMTVSACRNSCVPGTGSIGDKIDLTEALLHYKSIRSACYDEIEGLSHEDYYAFLCKSFADLDFNDFRREFEDKYRQPYTVPEDTIEEIFASMHKDTEMKKHLDCRSCGYDTCREMAIAIANGYARIQNCIHYMNDDLKVSSQMDRLTGIDNGRAFKDKIEKILSENDNKDKKYVICLGDINKLKSINALYGIKTGDKLIQYIAKRIPEVLGKDILYARMSGGIFGIFMENTEENMNRLTSWSSISCKHLDILYPVTMRFGIFELRKGDNVDMACDMAIFAADKTTDRSKNTFTYFNESMRNDLENDNRITLTMRKAMDDGEFVLFMQPQYDHRTGKIVGAEALSRWLKKDGTLVSPGIFIPVFEKNGFIRDMDKYVWETAFRLVKSWEDSKEPMVPVSVNISRISLGNDDIVSTIEKLQEKYQIDKSHLYFEITESAYMENAEALTERIAKIRNLGFEIAMDDFGSGYSSLNTLKDIPLDVLKLDMGFLRGGVNVKRGNVIIGHIVDMAKELGLKIVAEGVETKDQADMLTEKGCDVIQGFYYAKPMPLKEYEEKLKTDM